MNRSSIFLFTLFFLLMVQNGEAQLRTNIILILADDLGYMDCGYTGSKTFQTPVVDGLAKNGMVFSQAYAGAGNCTPSRATLISGQYGPRHGVYAVGAVGDGEHGDGMGSGTG